MWALSLVTLLEVLVQPTHPSSMCQIQNPIMDAVPLGSSAPDRFQASQPQHLCNQQAGLHKLTGLVFLCLLGMPKGSIGHQIQPCFPASSTTRD